MTTTLLKQGPADREQGPGQDESGLLEAVVRDKVLEALGRPADLYRVQVKHVWGDSYRANVFVGRDAASLSIAHSYFLRTDRDGKILACCPPIARAY